MENLTNSGRQVTYNAFNQPPGRSVSGRLLPHTWWRAHIAPDVLFEQCRDFYALERTFLAYLRTASHFAHFGVAAAQLFRLKGAIDPSEVSPYFHLGKPLGAVSQFIALLITFVGGFRCWEQQQRLIHGRIRSAGWEMLCIVLGTLAV